LQYTISKERLAAFSDGVFAVIITIMVLQLRLPDHATFAALWEEWPTALSYAVSYLLIVVMWINHHFLWSFTRQSTPSAIVLNFVHMFSASLVPFATAWVAESRISGVPVFVYAAVIVMVNLSYHAFAYEVMPRLTEDGAVNPMRRAALTRSLITLAFFAAAMLLSLKAAYFAFAVVTGILLTYALPEIPKKLRQQIANRGVTRGR
jgi:uncharacterized membrane protein